MNEQDLLELRNLDSTSMINVSYAVGQALYRKNRDLVTKISKLTEEETTLAFKFYDKFSKDPELAYDKLEELTLEKQKSEGLIDDQKRGILENPVISEFPNFPIRLSKVRRVPITIVNIKRNPRESEKFEFQAISDANAKKYLSSLAMSIDPFQAYDVKTISKLDIDFHKKNTILSKINQSNRLFKQSRFNESKKILKAVNKNLDEVERAGINSLLYKYFRSWMFHQAANIYLVQNEFNVAKDLYVKSLEIKEELKLSDLELILPTKLKLLAIDSFVNENFETFNLQMMELRDVIKTYLKSNSQTNQTLLNNLISDSYFYIVNNHFINGRILSFKDQFDMSWNLSVENEDFSNMIELKVKEDILTNIDNSSYVDNFLYQRPKVKHNPYLTTFLTQLEKYSSKNANLDLNKMKKYRRIFRRHRVGSSTVLATKSKK